MHDFLLKELITDDIEQELKNIGFDKTYTHFAKKKFEYKNFKIMLHPTHKKEPQKGWHIAIQHKTLSGNWRPTIPDIPLKTLGKVFMNWAKNWLK